MFSLVRYLVICNLTTETDAETGDKIKSVIDGKICICNKDLVGLQVQQLAQSQNMIFNNSLEIDRMFYNEQKYCYCDNQLYEIKGVGKGSKPHLMKLNVVKNDDAYIKQVIEEWIKNANIQ